MNGILNTISQNISVVEREIGLFDLQAHLKNLSFDLTFPSRSFIGETESEITFESHTINGHLFLLSDILLVTKSEIDGYFEVVVTLDLENSNVESQVMGIDRYAVTFKDTLYNFSFKSKQICEEWKKKTLFAIQKRTLESVKENQRSAPSLPSHPFVDHFIFCSQLISFSITF